MVDITNRDKSLLPVNENIEIAQPAAPETEIQENVNLAPTNNLPPTQSNDPMISSRLLQGRPSLNTDALRDQIAARLQSQERTESAQKPVINAPVSMFDDRSSSGQKSVPAQGERDQIKMELATRFPAYATLPAATQNAIADLFV